MPLDFSAYIAIVNFSIARNFEITCFSCLNIQTKVLNATYSIELISNSLVIVIVQRRALVILRQRRTIIYLALLIVC